MNQNDFPQQNLTPLMPEPTEDQPKRLSRKSKKMIGKIILLVSTVALVISPIDFIPDVFPVIGWIDDAIYILTALATIITMITGKKKGD